MIQSESLGAYKIGLASGVDSKTVLGSDDLQSKRKSFLSVKGLEPIDIIVNQCVTLNFSKEDFN